MMRLLNRPRLRRKDVPDYLRTVHGIDIAYSTLSKLATIGGGPQMQYSGRIPLYLKEDLDRWANERLSGSVRSTSARETAQVERIVPATLQQNQPTRVNGLSPVTTHMLGSQVTLAIQAAGGVVALARGLGIKHHQSVYGWKKIPADYVLRIEALTGIPCCELRPDIYPPDRFPPLPREAY